MSRLRWTEVERSGVCAALSYSGHYTISHRPEEYTLSYRPPGTHNHVGTYQTLAKAKAAAGEHAKSIGGDGGPTP